MVPLPLSSWNVIYKELLRWQSLLEESTLTRHIPYSRGTGLFYSGRQERMREKTNTRDCSHYQAKGERHEKPLGLKSSSEEEEEEGGG